MTFYVKRPLVRIKHEVHMALHFAIELATPLILKNVHIKNVIIFPENFTRYSGSESIYLCKVNM